MRDSQALRTMMVDTQVRPSDVTKYPIIEAMLAVPREDFVPDTYRAAAYADAQVDLGAGRAMLEPRTLAKILDALDIQPGELVLDLGTGLGYSAAVVARMAEFVVALEEDEALAADAEARLGAAGIDNVAVITGPLDEGDARHGPYDVILVEGAVQVVLVLAAAKLLFGVPFVGSFSLLLLGIFLFVLALVLLGYTISTLARTQMQAMQLTFFVFLPSLLLSGFMFPFRGMPGWAQVLGELFPLTHFLRMIRSVMLKGADLANVSAPLAALGVFVLVYAGLALMRFRRTLD